MLTCEEGVALNPVIDNAELIYLFWYFEDVIDIEKDAEVKRVNDDIILFIPRFNPSWIDDMSVFGDAPSMLDGEEV